MLADAMQYDVLLFIVYLPTHIYTHSLVYTLYVCEDVVCGHGNVLNSHCE